MEKKLYPCPVCNSPNQLYDEGGFDICSVCGWEDDDSQRLHADEDGINAISLNQAKKMWAMGLAIYDGYPNPQSKN